MTVSPPSADRLGRALLPFAGIAVALLVWEISPRVGLVSIGSVPPFSTVVAGAFGLFADLDFWKNLAASSGRWASGLTLGILIGVPLGIAMGRNRLLFMLVDPLLTMSYPIPKAALILIFVLWWGAGDLSRIAIIIMGCLIPIVISSYHGARAIETRLVWSARALGTRSGLPILAKIVLPAALPQICAGLRLAIAISIFTLLASELLIRQSGIGSYMFTFLDDGQTVQVWACAMILATIAFLLDLGFVRIVHASLRWFEGDV
jgi:ABC-type nitrate/sulfonate/bicarbonate transport system permease component